MRLTLFAALALSSCTPAYAQDKCATVTVSSAQAKDLPALIGDAECYGKAAVSASNSQVLRLKKAKELASAPVVVPPKPEPPVEPPVTTKTIAAMNIGGLAYYSPERYFANLLAGSSWQMGWTDIPASGLSSDGMPLSVPTDQEATISLGRSNANLLGKDVTIRCTFTGEGTFDIRGARGGTTKASSGSVEFEWPGNVTGGYIGVKFTNPAKPVRGLDCREKDMDRSAVFAPEFIESIKPYSALRFMDWQNINGNLPIKWADRRLPASTSQMGPDGVAIEHMVDLSNKVAADPWFSVPWNADDAYVRNFAILVRDRLAKDRKVYVELSNEVWNYMFPVTHQAVAEGEARNLNPANKWEGALNRYGQKSAEVLKVWTEVFAAEPQRLVRVVSLQHFSDNGDLVLGFQGAARYVDAVATAPYFGYDLFSGDRAQERNLDVLFPILTQMAKSAISHEGVRAKAMADKYKKRYIAYEAGQHIVHPDDVAIVEKLNRDPRMYDIYRQYLADWKALTGDTLALYNSGGSISKYGAWGIREYAGQPLSETPKRRAVLDFIAAGR